MVALSIFTIPQNNDFNPVDLPTEHPVPGNYPLESNEQELNQLKERLDQIVANLDTLSSPSKTSALSLKLTQFDQNISNFSDRLKKLENVIMNNPTKALEIPLLRKDLENQKRTQKEQLISIRNSIKRIYDLSKWLLGAIAISIITLAFGNFLKINRA